jgi:hypothetical protein
MPILLRNFVASQYINFFISSLLKASFQRSEIKNPPQCGGHFIVCGEKGIRTLDTREGILAFQASQINHSCTSPKNQGTNIGILIVI